MAIRPGEGEARKIAHGGLMRIETSGRDANGAFIYAQSDRGSGYAVSMFLNHEEALYVIRMLQQSISVAPTTREAVATGPSFFDGGPEA